MLEWRPNIGVAEILTLLGLIAAIVSLLFAIRQLKINTNLLKVNTKQHELTTRVERGRFLLAAAELYFGDAEAAEFFYALDYDTFRFEPDTFKGSTSERQLDKILYTFDIVGRVTRLETLYLDDVAVLAFQTARVFDNEEVLKYLAWLENQYAHHGGRDHTDQVLRPHVDALWLAETLLGKPIDYGRYKQLYPDSSRRNRNPFPPR